MANPSFETPGTMQGMAQDWSVGVHSAEEAIGCFNVVTGPLGVETWDPWEEYEDGWRLPYYTHFAQDTVNIVTAPDASVGNLPSQVALILDIADMYDHHRVMLTDPADANKHIHLTPDVINIITLSEPTNLPEAIIAANALRSILWDPAGTDRSSTEVKRDRGHFSEWPGVHRKEDVPNRPSAIVVTTETQMVTLINSMKAKFNAHRLLMAYGKDNGDALNEFTPANLDSMVIGTLTYEGFETGWAIPDIYPVTRPPLSPPPARQECQDNVVEMDTTAPSWPGGHIQLLSDLSDIQVEVGLDGGETFERGWFLPGSSSSWPNERFVLEFWDPAIGEFVFRTNRTFFGIADTFESGWKSCEIGLAKYWSGTEWRFKSDQDPPDRQLFPAGLYSHTYSFATWTLNPGSGVYGVLLVPPQFSPNLSMKVTAAIGPDPCCLTVNFLDENATARTLYVFLAGGEAINTVIDTFGLTSDPVDPKYAFTAKWGGLRAITSITASIVQSGAVSLYGDGGCVETFESDWVLTLT